MGMSQRRKGKKKRKGEQFPQLSRQGDSVFGHMSDTSSNWAQR